MSYRLGALLCPVVLLQHSQMGYMQPISNKPYTGPAVLIRRLQALKLLLGQLDELQVASGQELRNKVAV